MPRNLIVRLLLTVVTVAIAAPALAQPFLYSTRQTRKCDPSGCGDTYLVITNARTGEVVNADDPPLLRADEGAIIVNAMTTSVDGKRLYISTGYPGGDPLGRIGRLYVINLVTNRTEAAVPMQRNPWMLVTDPGGRVLYGANPIDGRVVVIDAISGQVTRSVAVGFPFAMALSSDGSLLAVTEPPTSVVTLIDTVTMTTRMSVKVPNYPQRVGMSPDGKRIYICSYAGTPGGLITTIDAETGAILNSTATGGFSPARILVSPKSGKLYVTFQQAGAWGVVDVAGNLTTYDAEIGQAATMAASDDWRHLYIAGLNGIVVIDTASDAFEGRLPGGSDLYLAVSTPCDFVLPAVTAQYNRAGGTGAIQVPAPAGCEWAVQNVSLPPQLQITSTTSGVGPGTVTYSVAPSATPFTASIRIANQSAKVSQEIPWLWVDTPGNGATVSSPFVIAGWTLAQAVGATSSGIDVVHAWAFPADGSVPRFLGSATMNGARPDVAAAIGPAYASSGFSVTTPWLKPGRYQISVYGRSRTGQFDAFAAFNITAVGESGVMALDFPSTDLLLQPGQTTIFVAGWAFDRAAASGTGVDTIHVWAFPVGPGDPVFLGSPAYGNARPDVGAFFGARFTDSGFAALLPKPSRPGTYDVAVFARSTTTGLFDQWRVVRIQVVPAPFGGGQ